MKLVTKKITEIIPYENNPRINDQAVDAVAESIKQCGYVQRIVVDEEGIILAGHTRFKALQQLGYEQVEVAVAEGLTEEQKKKYRHEELANLDFGDFDFGLALSQEATVENMDALFEDAPEKGKEPKKIQCPHCGEWFEA